MLFAYTFAAVAGIALIALNIGLALDVYAKKSPHQNPPVTQAETVLPDNNGTATTTVQIKGNDQALQTVTIQ